MILTYKFLPQKINLEGFRVIISLFQGIKCKSILLRITLLIFSLFLYNDWVLWSLQNHFKINVQVTIESILEKVILTHENI